MLDCPISVYFGAIFRAFNHFWLLVCSLHLSWTLN